MGEIKKSQSDVVYFDENNKVRIPKGVNIPMKYKEAYISKLNFKKIKDIKDKNVVAEEIYSYINQTVADSGYNMTEDEISYVKTRSTSDIITNFDDYTLEEVRLSMYYGIRKELCESYGISVISIQEWLKAFRYVLQTEANKQMQKFLPKAEKKKPSPRQVDETIGSTLAQEFEKYVKTNQYDYYDLGNIGFNLLLRLGLLKLTTKEFELLLEKAREDFKAHIENRNVELSKKGLNIQRIDLPRAFEELESKSNDKFEHQIEVGAKRKAVFEYMTKLKNEKKNLRQMLIKAINSKEYGDGSI